MRRIADGATEPSRPKDTSLPALRRDVALPDSLSSIIPSCAQSCMTAFLTSGFAPLCSDLNDLSCLCGSTISSGYTLGEVALACTDSHCSAPSVDTEAAAYQVCEGQAGAVQPTHSVLTLSTPTPSASSTSSRTSGSQTIRTQDAIAQSTTTPAPSDETSLADTADNVTSTSTKQKGLSTGAAAGISIATILIIAIIIYIVWYMKCHKKRKSEEAQSPVSRDMQERDLPVRPLGDERDSDSDNDERQDGQATDSDDDLNQKPATAADMTSDASIPAYSMRGALGTQREDAKPRYHISNDSPIKKPSPVELDSHEIMRNQPQKPASVVQRNKPVTMSERARQDTLRSINPRKPPPSAFNLRPHVESSDESDEATNRPALERYSTAKSAVLTPVTPGFPGLKTADLSPVSALDRHSMAPASLPIASAINSLPSRSSSTAARPAPARTASQRSTRKPGVRFDSQTRTSQAVPAPGPEAGQGQEPKLLPSRYQGYQGTAKPEALQPKPAGATTAVRRPWQDDTPIMEEEDEDYSELMPEPLTPRPKSVAFEQPPSVPAFPASLQRPPETTSTDASSESGESRPDFVNQGSDDESQRARSTSRVSERSTEKKPRKVTKTKAADGEVSKKRVRRVKPAPSVDGSVSSEASLIMTAEQRAERRRKREERRQEREKRKAEGADGKRGGRSSSKIRKRRDLESEGSVVSEASSTLSREERLKERAARSKDRAERKERSASRSSERSKTSSSGEKIKKSSSSAPRKRKESRATDDLYGETIARNDSIDVQSDRD